MGGALVSFMAMAVGARELSAELGTFQILFIRSVIGLLVLALLLSRSGWRQLATANVGLHFARNIAHYAGQFGWFYAIAFIPLAAVFAIETTTPIWTAVFAVLLLSERMTWARFTAIFLGFAGVLLILRPGTAVIHPAAAAALLGAVAFGLSITLTKKLAARDSPMAILFYMALIQLPLGLLPATYNWVNPALPLWPWLIVVGLTSLTAHYCMVRALSIADATVVIPMDFLRLPLISLVGFVMYNERIEWFLFAGAALVLAGNLVNVRAEQRGARQTDRAIKET
jgi:drug/metabolite transporter (DMT)-like permease